MFPEKESDGLVLVWQALEFTGKDCLRHVLMLQPPGFTVIQMEKYLAGGLQSGYTVNLSRVQYKYTDISFGRNERKPDRKNKVMPGYRHTENNRVRAYNQKEGLISRSLLREVSWVFCLCLLPKRLK